MIAAHHEFLPVGMSVALGAGLLLADGKWLRVVGASLVAGPILGVLALVLLADYPANYLFVPMLMGVLGLFFSEVRETIKRW